VLPGLGVAANQHADIEGIITSFSSAGNFALQRQNVITDANTQFVLHGIALGVNVEVDLQGTFNASGVLLAQKVEIRPESSSLVRGPVDSVTATSNTLSVLGVKITTSASTEFDDKSNQHVRLFRLADLGAGDYVEVRGAESQPGMLSASILVRDNAENRSYLQGNALNVAEPNLTVLGVTVITNAQTHFAGPGGATTGAATFFAQAANRVVRVRGTFSGGVFTADQAQIQQ
jgi:hypothetical protein